MSAVGALTYLAPALVSQTAVRKAHEHPPQSLDGFPVAVVEFVEGVSVQASAGDLTNDEWTIMIGVFYPLNDLKRAATVLRPIVRQVLTLLWSDVTLGGNCVSINEIRFRGPGQTTYNTIEYYGLRFDVELLFKV